LGTGKIIISLDHGVVCHGLHFGCLHLCRGRRWHTVDVLDKALQQMRRLRSRSASAPAEAARDSRRQHKTAEDITGGAGQHARPHSFPSLRLPRESPACGAGRRSPWRASPCGPSFPRRRLEQAGTRRQTSHVRRSRTARRGSNLTRCWIPAPTPVAAGGSCASRRGPTRPCPAPRRTQAKGGHCRRRHTAPMCAHRRSVAGPQTSKPALSLNWEVSQTSPTNLSWPKIGAESCRGRGCIIH